MSTTSGAWERRARLAASLGRPIPTKQTWPLLRPRAAVTVIISSGVNVVSSCAGSTMGTARDHFQIGGMVGRLDHEPSHPLREGDPITGDDVPFGVERVVP